MLHLGGRGFVPGTMHRQRWEVSPCVSEGTRDGYDAGGAGVVCARHVWVREVLGAEGQDGSVGAVSCGVVGDVPVGVGGFNMGASGGGRGELRVWTWVGGGGMACVGDWGRDVSVRCVLGGACGDCGLWWRLGIGRRGCSRM